MNADLYAEYTARSSRALQVLVDEHQVQLRRFPDTVLSMLREQSADVRADIAATDAITRKVNTAYEDFLKQVSGWTGLTEYAFLKARS